MPPKQADYFSSKKQAELDLPGSASSLLRSQQPENPLESKRVCFLVQGEAKQVVAACRLPLGSRQRQVQPLSSNFKTDNKVSPRGCASKLTQSNHALAGLRAGSVESEFDLV